MARANAPGGGLGHKLVAVVGAAWGPEATAVTFLVGLPGAGGPAPGGAVGGLGASQGDGGAGLAGGAGGTAMAATQGGKVAAEDFLRGGIGGRAQRLGP